MAEKTGEFFQEKKKKKLFRWTPTMVEKLIMCLASYKTEMEYHNIDFDAVRVMQYTTIRTEKAFQ